MTRPAFRPITHLVLPALALALLAGACGSTTETTETTLSPGTDSTTATTGAPTTTTDTDTTTTTAPTESETISVYFAVGDGSDCTQVQSFERQVPKSETPYASAFNELLAGPTAEEIDAGAGSFFSDMTASGMRSIGLENGLLTVDFVDFRADLNNASTSCGSASLLASLNATAFGFSEVERVRYSVFGSCGAFYGWLQSECQDQTRTGAVPVDLNTNDEASGSGCIPGTAVLPDGDWFGFVSDVFPSAIDFDLACWFTGIAAAEAAAEDGQESPPPNDYYVRNESDEVRKVSVSPGVIVMGLEPTGGSDPVSMAYEDWYLTWPSRSYRPGIWITIVDGEIVTIAEQYVP